MSIYTTQKKVFWELFMNLMGGEELKNKRVRSMLEMSLFSSSSVYPMYNDAKVAIRRRSILALIL